MTASTEGYIHINAVGLDVQSVNALLQEHRYVICLSVNNQFSLFILHFHHQFFQRLAEIFWVHLIFLSLLATPYF